MRWWRGWLAGCLLLLASGQGWSAAVSGGDATWRARCGEMRGDAPRLTHGINITGWFRFPVSRDPARLRAYMSDRALADVRAAGFDFVRLAVDPDVTDPRVLVSVLRRIERQCLAVIVSPQPVHWRLESDGERLVAFWRRMAPALRGLDPVQTVPEVVNEPVFPGDPAGWAVLQRRVLRTIRTALPGNTVVLTGQDWGSLGGLLALRPVPDAHVVYSFHFYDPVELTSLAAYRPGLDRSVLAGLPFPVRDQAACDAEAAGASDAATRAVARGYCAGAWSARRIKGLIDRAAAWGRRYHVRLIAGEFGATTALNRASRLAWLGVVRRALEEDHIGWALWGYDDVMGLAVPRPPRGRPVLDRGVLGVLGLPRPG